MIIVALVLILEEQRWVTIDNSINPSSTKPNSDANKIDKGWKLCEATKQEKDRQRKKNDQYDINAFNKFVIDNSKIEIKK